MDSHCEDRTVSWLPYLFLWESAYMERPFLYRDVTLAIYHSCHDDVIKREHFPSYWPFARGIHRSPVNSPNKGQWRGALMFSLICACINGWGNNREAGDLRHNRAHYEVIVMTQHMAIWLYGIDILTSSCKWYITKTSQWGPWWLISPAFRLFAQSFVGRTLKKISKFPVISLSEGNPT